MPFDEKEKAVLVVNGHRFDDWTSVTVVHRQLEAYPIAVFECTEQAEMSNAGPSQFFWSTLQIKPGDSCEIYLAGILALSGYVVVRQAGYDDKTHGVQITAMGRTQDLTVSSAVTKTGNFDGQSWEAIARRLLQPFGVSLKVVGNIDATPFKQMQIQPGELVWSTLERLARSRTIVLGSSEKGELVAIGDHDAPADDALVEGRNILRANCTIDDRHVMQKYFAIGQRPGSDDAWGSEVAEIAAQAPGSAKRYRPHVTIMEHPEEPNFARKRAEFEKLLREGAEVTAQITVQGWLRANGDLWRVLQTPSVRSPMLMVDFPLTVIEATYRQDGNGTTTTMTLVMPWMVNGRMSWGANQPTPPGDGAVL